MNEAKGLMKGWWLTRGGSLDSALFRYTCDITFTNLGLLAARLTASIRSTSYRVWSTDEGVKKKPLSTSWHVTAHAYCRVPNA